MKIHLHEGDIHLLNLRTRLPFKYGIATMTAMPYALVRVDAEVDGRQASGVSADILPPKWFTKDPARPITEEIPEMLAVIQNAVSLVTDQSGETPFALWWQLYRAQADWAQRRDIPPLLAHFGTSLVERAMIDAICRSVRQPFARLLRENVFGVRLETIHPELEGSQPDKFLPATPLAKVTARHTVGLADPLTNEAIPEAERLNDGLPQSLAANITRYGLRQFKIKVNGRLEEDLERLQRVAEVIQKNAPSDHAFTLDGNEQFKSLSAFREFWEAIMANPHLREFFRSLIFVEQPLPRDVALGRELEQEFRRWPNHPPMIIDESDATVESLRTALELGYAGTSHKNCKGVFKGIANRCRLLQLQEQYSRRTLIMSGEDLCNVGPVALLQDLALMSALGISSVERNGHHYVAGLSAFPADIQHQMLRTHGDLYQPSRDSWPTLKILEGRISMESINRAPFGLGFHLDPSRFTPAAEWRMPQ